MPPRLHAKVRPVPTREYPPGTQLTVMLDGVVTGEGRVKILAVQHPFIPMVGLVPRRRDLFHLAPHVAIKFRGLPESRREAAAEAALATYVASNGDPALADPRLAFALCYLAGHLGLDLVEEHTVERVMARLAPATPSQSRKGLRSSRGRKKLPNSRMVGSGAGAVPRRR
jgi:hypothetical protein